MYSLTIPLQQQIKDILDMKKTTPIWLILPWIQHLYSNSYQVKTTSHQIASYFLDCTHKDDGVGKQIKTDICLLKMNPSGSWETFHMWTEAAAGKLSLTPITSNSFHWTAYVCSFVNLIYESKASGKGTWMYQKAMWSRVNFWLSRTQTA